MSVSKVMPSYGGSAVYEDLTMVFLGSGGDRQRHVAVSRDGRALGGVALRIRKKGSGRNGLTFTYPTINQGLVAVAKYFKGKL